MPVNVIIPKLGMTMREAKLVKWQCKEGEQVEEGDVIAEIETEKITYQIEAPISGILAKILVEEGKVAPVGQVIGIMIEEGEAFDESAIPAAPVEVALSKQEIGAPAETKVEAASTPSGERRIKITPVARKIAKEKG
ncbi:MAG: biotin/lipoyl-binding protein, partial [Deltaproteobacteria bacterium]